MAKIGGLHPSATLDSEAETGEAAFPGTEEPIANHQDMGRRSWRDGRRPRSPAGNSDDAGPADATHLEFALTSEPEPEPADVTGGMEVGRKALSGWKSVAWPPGATCAPWRPWGRGFRDARHVIAFRRR